MRYKQRVQLFLTGVDNRMASLVNLIENGAPMTREELAIKLKEVHKDIEQISNLVDLERDDVLIATSPNLV